MWLGKYSPRGDIVFVRFYHYGFIYSFDYEQEKLSYKENKMNCRLNDVTNTKRSIQEFKNKLSQR